MSFLGGRGAVTPSGREVGKGWGVVAVVVVVVVGGRSAFPRPVRTNAGGREREVLNVGEIYIRMLFPK